MLPRNSVSAVICPVIYGGPSLTVLELFRRVRSSQGFSTLESSHRSNSKEYRRAPVVDSYCVT